MRKVFLQRSKRAIEDTDLQRALDQNAERRGLGRDTAFASITNLNEIRSRAHDIRSSVIDTLPELLQQFEENMKSNGWHVHRAATALEACTHVARIAAEHGARLVVKSKSMVTEEIRLNDALAEAGVKTIETDLGEFIVQLRKEPPGHIITPAIHLLSEDVARTFVEHLGIDFTTDVSRLNQAARQTLRKAFLKAGIGISGTNFGIVEPGAICLVTNEGNGRMVTSLPEVHIAVMGIERLVRTLGELEIMLQLLPRSATGQVLTSYVSLLHSSRNHDDLDGPTSRHVVLLDNGRRALRHTRFQSALLCIRCGACLNVCPVYREIGGHAYDSVYPGPIGSIVSPALFDLKNYGHLAKASTLCGACQEACPVNINLPELLLRTRDEYILHVQQPVGTSLFVKAFRWFSSSPGRFLLALRLVAIFSRLFPAVEGWTRRMPGPFKNWTRYRDFPRFTTRPFRNRFPHQRVEEAPTEKQAQSVTPAPLSADRQKETQRPSIDRFEQALKDVDGEFTLCAEVDLGSTITRIMSASRYETMLIDPAVASHYPDLIEQLECAGKSIIFPQIDPAGDHEAQLAGLDRAELGISLCLGAFAESGTIVVGQDHENATVTSLLPEAHIALIPKNRLYETFASWVEAGGSRMLAEHQSLTLITGPSRTADIEMTLTIGVHGPGRLIVLAVE